jgi:hypothetical protein
MNKRSIVAVAIGAAVVIALFFGGRQLWNVLLVMHGHKPQ